MGLSVAKKESRCSVRFSTTLKSRRRKCTKRGCLRQRLLIFMLFRKNTRTSAFLSGTFPLRPRLASCMRNGELSRAPAATRQAALRRLVTLVRNKAVETVDGMALAARGRRFRITFSEGRLDTCVAGLVVVMLIVVQW